MATTAVGKPKESQDLDVVDCAGYSLGRRGIAQTQLGKESREHRDGNVDDVADQPGRATLSADAQACAVEGDVFARTHCGTASVMRVNKAIELLQQHQPIYFEFVDGFSAGAYEGGRALAQTWADYIAYDVEHSAFDMPGLAQFMRGLADGGRTKSGHRTPAVIVTLPMDGTDAQSVRANSWMIKHVLATGVHGLLLCHAEAPEAVQAFVEAARYTFRSPVESRLGVGRRGHGGQNRAAEVWGTTVDEYFTRADPWPLNPNGELLLGIKVENTRALDRVEQTTRVPGLAFAEWGPGDMGMSMGYPDQHDEPYPREMQAARTRVMTACKAAGLAFLEQVTPENVVSRLAEGVMIGCGPRARDAADIGRRHTGRKLAW